MLRTCLTRSLSTRIIFKRNYVGSSLINGICQNHNDSNNLSPKILRLPTNHNINKETELPPAKYPYTSIYDKIPLMNVNLPCVSISDLVKDIKLPPSIDEGGYQCKGGLLKIRRKKMNKHKLKKRRKRDRAQIRKILMGREKNKRRVRARRKVKLIEKIETLKESNPQSTYAERSYVIHRLQKW